MSADSADTTRVTLLHRLHQNPADQLSWGEFFRTYSPAIRGWLLHWGLQEADAQDVAQNVLMRLTKKLPQFKYDPSKSFRGWLKTLTHHAWHDFVTEAGYRTRGSGDTSVLDQLQSVEAREDLAARVEATFDRELLEMALVRARERVAENTWLAFKLSALDGVAPQTVADQVGIRVSQVYLAKHRVQKLVQEEIRALEGADGEDEPRRS
ncbi:RNA polymerase sigma factor RpoE [Gemmata obscuriglobus]|uniref:Sigma-70 family RNA polymerase sigma factor n=1 Tax=Gemmata obscuriglobus TaxID=114 RepID=A0A2Z3HDW2_9BACT|nr:sigma-70 family RNA polymerase sigma factor [Gemmata obscuriglobus]AWM39480.1 sigma-70 family RNA polymerase sigma factor [Gemmata obscuriglobus]QEG27434.1 RNA polymerase sigma factor RpoE [Gemmata obscuriglobus]VTS04387.1 sigma-70 family rna polymerase sigma factor : RNA polymerase sigma factor, sigma-70 family OS=Singulisphaera acidiphila (strain ATCC BAA-1392 / DSM 18658 / VKM B-2454 / MOB10) GN=Sinac_7049 PE=4 SV=1: Sigma70_r2 [Gemmata obscuriglobus UQM 2246]